MVLAYFHLPQAYFPCRCDGGTALRFPTAMAERLFSNELALARLAIIPPAALRSWPIGSWVKTLRTLGHRVDRLRHRHSIFSNIPCVRRLTGRAHFRRPCAQRSHRRCHWSPLFGLRWGNITLDGRIWRWTSQYLLQKRLWFGRCSGHGHFEKTCADSPGEVFADASYTVYLLLRSIPRRLRDPVASCRAPP